MAKKKTDHKARIEELMELVRYYTAFHGHGIIDMDDAIELRRLIGHFAAELDYYIIGNIAPFDDDEGERLDLSLLE